MGLDRMLRSFVCFLEDRSNVGKIVQTADEAFKKDLMKHLMHLMKHEIQTKTSQHIKKNIDIETCVHKLMRGLLQHKSC